MATKRSTLPPVTPQDTETNPERLRLTPNGGHAWKCHYCSAYASSETQEGRYVCRRHGGVTPKQREPQIPVQNVESGAVARPPGRPLTSGAHSRSPRLTVNELVQEYEEQLGDADATDEHMIYLRGHLDMWAAQREDEDDVEVSLVKLGDLSQKLEQLIKRQTYIFDGETLHQVIWTLHAYARDFSAVQERYQRFMHVTREIEKRHAQFIRLSKIRIDIREKHSAVHQLREFTHTLPKVLGILEPRLDDNTRERLKARLQQEFSTIPMRALAQNTLSHAQPALTEPTTSLGGTTLDFLAVRFAAMGGQADNSRQDMLYLKAYLKTMTSLSDIIRDTIQPLTALQETLEHYLERTGLGREGTPQQVSEILEDYKCLKLVMRLQRGIKDLVILFYKFDAELEARHARIIQLALVRAEMQLKEQSAERLMLQRHLLRRLHAVLLEVVSQEDVAYVQTHMLEASNTGIPWIDVNVVPAEGEKVPRVDEKGQTAVMTTRL